MDLTYNSTSLRQALSTEWLIIMGFAVLKLSLHWATLHNFELHRDAYLYYALSEHLAWGYISVPPQIAVLGKIATFLFGHTTFGLRFFPALFGAFNLVIIGLSVRALGGKKVALTLASCAYLLSPAYLHSNALFQPVTFNQFYWLLSSYLVLLMINRNEPKFWMGIAFVFGLGFLNKYSILFFFAAFAIALLLTPSRQLYLSKYFLFSVILGFIIICPNLFWQWQHNWPILIHMSELREHQLIHVKVADFLFNQVLMNAHAFLLWFSALVLLLFGPSESKYRSFGLTYLFIILILLLGSGKAYYALGIYPILFAFGACFFEKYVHRFQWTITIVLIVLMAATLYISTSLDGIPLATADKVRRKEAFRWEDGTQHDIPQDMADMTGWKEVGEKTNDILLGLGTGRNNCDIFCENYGQAGAVMFYGKKYNIPQPISFNGSFLFWAPDQLTKDHLIWINSEPENVLQTDSLLNLFFSKHELRATIENPDFRENGTRIFLCSFPTEIGKSFYARRVSELKKRYRRN